MKKILIGFIVLSLFLVPFMFAAKPAQTCTTIQDGTLLASDESVITTGYDLWGYNYQANMFNGYYCDSYRDAAWCQEWKEDRLLMKWNNAWLANVDCNNDGLLDRHSGFSSYIGSGAWLTNHQSGTYEIEDKKVYNLAQKDPSTWEIILGGASGQMIYTPNEYEFVATGLMTSTEYSLMYYPDPWPGTGCQILGAGIADESGNLVLTGNFGFSQIPIETDLNKPKFKIWLVPSSNVNCPNGMMGWNPTTYLFDVSVENYICSWNYFTKIVAAPEDANQIGGVWYTADEKEIGPAIWGEFAIIQEVLNDPCTGAHGLAYNAPVPTGFGFYKP